MDASGREETMSGQVVECVVCGRRVEISDLVPVKLVAMGRGAVLSGACGGCMLDVDGAAKARRKNCLADAVVVEVAGETWMVIRR
jgi:hypothetical protein